VEIHWKAPSGKLKEAQGETVSISSNGVHMTSPQRFAPNARHHHRKTALEFTKVPLVLHCQGRVVRQAPGATGLRAVIDDYKLHPAERKTGKSAAKSK